MNVWVISLISMFILTSFSLIISYDISDLLIVTISYYCELPER